MNTTHPFQFSNRRWSLVLFLAVLVGIAQFGLGQFSPWVIAGGNGVSVQQLDKTNPSNKSNTTIQAR